MSVTLNRISNNTVHKCNLFSPRRLHHETQAALWRVVLSNSGFASRRCLFSDAARMHDCKSVPEIGHRKYSTGQSDDKAPSLFDPSADPWKEMLTDVPETPPTSPPRRQLLRPTLSADSQRAGRQRANLTMGETVEFDRIFSTIFGAVQEHNVQRAHRSSGSSDEEPQPIRILSRRSDPLSGAGIGVGIGRSNLSGDGATADIINQLRRQQKNVKSAGGEEELFERMREQIDFCATDQELLAWATRYVYGEGTLREQNASQNDAKASLASPPSFFASPSSPPPPLPMKSRAYALTIALLMNTFRTRYNDPHLSLALFQHTKQLSITSYVFGCTVPVYNELIATRWYCFKDLRGVLDAMEEMRVNGVEPDKETRAMVEEIRREVGADGAWIGDEKAVEVWDMLRRIEQLSVRSVATKTLKGTSKGFSKQKNTKRQNVAREQWKFEGEGKGAIAPAMTEDGSWRFGEWNTHT